MKNFNALCIVILSLFPIYGKSQTLDWKFLQPLSSKFYIPEVVAQDENSAYCISVVFAKKMLEKYDKKTGKLVYSVKFDHPDDMGGKDLGVFLVQNSIYNFFDINKKGNNYVYSYEINKETGAPVEGSLKEYACLKNNAMWASLNSIAQSPDKSKIIIIHEVNNEYVFTILDKDLNVVKIVNDHYECGNNQGYGRCLINNDGSFFCIGYTNIEATQQYSNSNNGHKGVSTSLLSKSFDLIVAFDARQDYSKRSLNTKDARVFNSFNEDFVAKINSQGQLTICGFVYNTASMADISPSGDIVRRGKWGSVYFNEDMGIKTKQLKGEIKKLDFLEDSLSNRYIIAQIGQNTYEGSMDFGDIYVISLNNDLTLKWKKGINLFQRMKKKMAVEARFQKPYYMFFPCMKNNKLLVVYNDNILNKTNVDIEKNKYQDSETGIIVIYSFELLTGEFKKTVAENPPESDLQFIPGGCSYIDGKDVLFSLSKEYISMGVIK